MAAQPSAPLLSAPLTLTLWLRVGADLQPEPWSPAQLQKVRAALAAGAGLDGAIEGRIGAEAWSRLDYWDRLDGLLVALRDAVERLLAGGSASEFSFPDTGIEARLWRCEVEGTAAVAITYEDIDTVVPLGALGAALDAAGVRLVEACGTLSPALRRLAIRGGQASDALDPKASDSTAIASGGAAG